MGLVDPRTAHTDNDSVTDAREDFDGDGLDTAREQQAGTHLNQTDTDDDGLSDATEVRERPTDPLSSDTDDDGLNDTEELDLPTDPTVADTDGDGVNDGNETFTTSKTDNETGVTVNVTGEGNVAATLSVNNSSEAILQTNAVENVSASSVYEFEAAANFSTANITLPYDESKVSAENESSLGAYRYNETLQTFVPVNNSTVDAANDTVTAETPHFSSYTVLDSEKWESRFDEPLPSKWSDTDNFSDLSEWESDGDVSQQVESVDTVGSFALREEDDATTDRNASVVVGSLTKPSDRSWTKPKGNETRTNESDENVSAEYAPPAFRGGGSCDGDCQTETTTEETTTEETTEEEVTTEDSYEDSDGDGTYDRYDSCTFSPGEDGGCPEHSDDDGIRDYYDKCDTDEGEGNGCPTDSDGDGFDDFYDQCDNTKGTEQGCADNDDGDSYQDYYDDCPGKPGEGANGCPIDDDGDDTRNYYDDCPQFPGWKANGCPRTSSLERTITLRDAETITVGTRAKATVVSKRSVAKLVVIGPDGDRVEVYGEENAASTSRSSTRRVKQLKLGAQAILPGSGGEADHGYTSVERDISQFAGEQVTIKVVTVGRATFEIDALKIGYDTDGDNIYDAIERGSCGLRDGRGQCLDTDPRLADTDGDGLSDGLEVGPRKKVHGHVYQSLQSNPTVRDTDRDGLDDETEMYKWFYGGAATSRKASKQVVTADPDDALLSLSPWYSHSNPLTADTDDDGLNDSEELLYGTNPDDPDTDDDGRIDGREITVGSPTLFDYKPPRIVRESASYKTGSFGAAYTVDYWVGDPSGVKSVKFRLGGDQLDEDDPFGYPQYIDGRRTFNTSRLTEFIDKGTGTTLTIKATDRYGNTDSKAVIRRANLAGNEVIDVCNEATATGDVPVDPNMGRTGFGGNPCVHDGFRTGLVYVAGSELKGIVDLGTFLTQPSRYLEPILGFVNLLQNLGMLDDLKDALEHHYADKHRLNNPYEEGTPMYEEYEKGWNTGIAVGYVFSAVLPGKVGKFVSGSSKLSKIEDVLTVGRRTERIISGAKTGYHTYKAAKLRAIQKTIDVPKSVVVKGGKTGVAVYRTAKLYRKLDADIPKGSRTEAGRFLARHGADGRKALDALDEADPGAARRVLALGTDCTGSSCPDSNEIRRFRTAVVKASEDGDVSEAAVARALRRVENLDGSTRWQTVEFMAEAGADGVRLAGKLDDDALRRLVKLDGDGQQILVDAWRSESIELTPEGVADISKTLDGLDRRAQRQALLAVEEADRDGIWLVRNVPESRLEELVDEGVDFTRHAEGLGIIRRSEKTVGDDRGDVAEIIAQKTVVEKYEKKGWVAIPRGGRKGIEVYFSDGSNVEFDHMILDSDGNIVKVFETKLSSNKAKEAEGQIRRSLAKMLPSSDKTITRSSPDGIDSPKVKVNPFTDDEDMITVGPKGNGYDEELDYSSRELAAIYTTIKRVQG